MKIALGHFNYAKRGKVFTKESARLNSDVLCPFVQSLHFGGKVKD
jgi:hypothetical protein